MLLNDSCVTAFARGTQSFQPRFDERTFLLSVLLWATCHCGVVPSWNQHDTETRPPRKVRRQCCCHQRELGVGRDEGSVAGRSPQNPGEPDLGYLGPTKNPAPTANLITKLCALRKRGGPRERVINQGFSNTLMLTNFWGPFSNKDASPWVWGVACESAFLISSQVTPFLQRVSDPKRLLCD